jgi:CRISPR-associated protein Cas2
MAGRQFVLVSYDISDDKRRRKVMQAMEDFGTRVQYSVFECYLSAAEVARLQDRLRPSVRHRDGDSVRFYFLDADSVGRTQVIGRGAVTSDQSYYLH